MSARLTRKITSTERRRQANAANGRLAQGPYPKDPTASPPDALSPANKLTLDRIVESLWGSFDKTLCPPDLNATLLAMDEDPALFARLHQDLLDEWQPSGALQRQLVRRLAYLLWRQQRCERSQDGMVLRTFEQEFAVRTRRLLEETSAPAESLPEEGKDEEGLRGAPDTQYKFQRVLSWLQFLRQTEGGKFRRLLGGHT